MKVRYNRWQCVATPFGRSYWVIPKWLLAGYYPGDETVDGRHENLFRLAGCGVRTIVDLMEADECDHTGRWYPNYEKALEGMSGEPGDRIVRVSRPMADRGVPTLEAMRAVLDTIDEALAKGRPVYVHCLGGLGRTGLVVGCYLVRHGMARPSEALAILEKLRRHEELARSASPEMPAQREFIAAWSQDA